MTSIWDLYLDVDDAADLLHAFAVLERHRAIREPLPLNDAPALLDRLRVVAGIAGQDVTHWEHESEDRRLESEVDGGRWGSSETARTMAGVAGELADGSRQIAEAAEAAAQDLARRLAQPGLDGAALAAEVSARDVHRLLSRAPETPAPEEWT
jgi:uncharacterized membrane protein